MHQVCRFYVMLAIIAPLLVRIILFEAIPDSVRLYVAIPVWIATYWGVVRLLDWSYTGDWWATTRDLSQPQLSQETKR